jgi:hypothetical protein
VKRPPRSANIDATTNAGSSSGTASAATNTAAPAAIPSQPHAARQRLGAVTMTTGTLVAVPMPGAEAFYAAGMGRDGLLIGDVAKQSGASRKALRLYEEAGILPAPRRTGGGYRVYGADALDLLAFVRQAQRLGFTLEEIKEIVAIQ